MTFDVEGLNERKIVVRTQRTTFETSHMKETAKRIAEGCMRSWTECRYIRVYYNGSLLAVADRESHRIPVRSK